MILNSAIIHEQNPGSDPTYLAEQLSSLHLPKSSIGIELDVTLKKFSRETEYVPVALSRDRSVRVDLWQHIESFTAKGFTGPFFLDLIDRRASASVIEVVQEHPDHQVLIQVPEMAIAYKTPKYKNSQTFAVEKFWEDAWPSLTVSSRFPHLAREFLDYGCKINMFWEPIEDDDYRFNLKPLLEKVDTIVYKMPHLTYSALFDPDTCMERDLDLFNSVANEMVVAPLVSVETLRAKASALFGTKQESQEDRPEMGARTYSIASVRDGLKRSVAV